MIENKSAMTPADAGPVHCPVGRLPVKTEPLFAKLIEALSSRHTYTEAEVRLVMLGMQAEIDRANDARQLQHCAIAVSDWLAGGCDVHDIPRPHIAALVEWTRVTTAEAATLGPNVGTKGPGTAQP